MLVNARDQMSGIQKFPSDIRCPVMLAERYHPRPRLGSGSTGNYPRTCDADASPWKNTLEPVDRSRFPRPILKIRRFSIPIDIKDRPRLLAAL